MPQGVGVQVPSSARSGRGGIGIRRGLKSPRRKACGFETHRPHQDAQSQPPVQAYAALMTRKPEDIVREIDVIRDRLVRNVEELVERLQPEAIAKRTFTKVEGGAKQAYGQAKAYYVDEATGQVRQDRAAKTGAVALGLLILRKLFK